ncbi:hypothetical protein ABA31_05070 [Agrococcus baldri]|uniref:Tripartite ATP-independent periplasmic transporters DctQ component domain-containing protein n=2 Tax=Agrococcus baldri TaxID=153730 RepID=A0AA87UQM8_9MICO|nr:hypothetical protein ABA31_05070 [Agrococcus baldri]
MPNTSPSAAGPSAARSRTGPLKTAVSIITVISRVFGYLARAMLVVMTVAFCYEVVARYVFNAPTGVVNQLGAVLTSMICVAMLGIALIDREHIRVDIVLNRLRPSARRWAELLNEVFSLAVISALFAAGVAAVTTSYESHVQEYFLNIAIDEWLILLSLVIGFGNMWLAQLAALLQWFMGDDTGAADEELPSYAEAI